MKKILLLLLLPICFWSQTVFASDKLQDSLPTENHKMGDFIYSTSSLSNQILFRAMNQLSPVDVNAGDKNTPGQDFIDVSYWNGYISTTQYSMMKNQYGIKGVVVKLTEGTYYINPYAESQIRNAQSAGLVVSVYHFSRYTTSEEAIQEANYFVNYMKKLKLNSSTIAVNDAEATELLQGNVTENSKSFINQVKAHGYNYSLLYTGKNWLNSGYIDPNQFGYKNIWVAQYPFYPAADSIWNQEYGSWQWSSQFYFPGIAHPFDISMSFTDYFVKSLSGYDIITEEKSLNKDGNILSTPFDEYGNKPWGTEGYQKLGAVTQFLNKDIKVKKEVVTTSNNKYYQFEADGNNYWTDYRNIKLFDQVVSEKPIDADGTIQYFEYSEYGSVPWGTRGYKRVGLLKEYEGQTVKITKEVTTSGNNTYYEFELNGQKYYGDVRNFKLKQYDQVVSEKPIDADGTIQYFEYSEYGSVPWGTRGYKRVGLLKEYEGQTVKITKEVTTSGNNTYYEFELNGQKYYGDVRNFKLKQYDQVVSEKPIDADGTIQYFEYSEYGSVPWGTRGYKRVGLLKEYEGQTVKITKEVTTSGNNTYYEFELNGQKYYGDVRNFKLKQYDQVVSEKPIDADGTIQYFEYSEYGSVPWGTRGYKRVGLLKEYEGQTVKITKEVTTSGNNTYYEFELNGQKYYGDVRNFKLKQYDQVVSEKPIDADGTIQYFEYSEYGSVPWGTRGYKRVGLLKEYEGQTVKITKEVTTSGNNTYYEFELNGQKYYGDVRNFKLKQYDQVVSEKPIDVDGTIQYFEYSEYGSVPWGTRGYKRVGLLKEYEGQTVKITKEVTTSGNNTYYEFELNGQKYYGDVRNFKLKQYDQVVSEKPIDADGTIQYFEYSEYGSVPWGTRGYKRVGLLKEYEGQTVKITKEVTTSGNNTYYEFELNGQKYYGDVRNFKLKQYDQVVSEKPMDADGTIQYFEYSEYGSVPWGTRGYKRVGLLKEYEGQTVKITKEVTTSGNNTYYEFELNGQKYYGDVRNFKLKQ
ncbi:GW dipeptide domain-containing protein [Enterococcus sp. LX10]|uniref:GW dipeptide domain-containing protein n=1 Tax=Enterococcus sp. LX10 TaxID=2920934 RepID=UPI00201EB18B|nr:GW dipeptide domain-containing protein [Enterococcus sp. LX10]